MPIWYFQVSPSKTEFEVPKITNPEAFVMTVEHHLLYNLFLLCMYEVWKYFQQFICLNWILKYKNLCQRQWSPTISNDTSPSGLFSGQKSFFFKVLSKLYKPQLKNCLMSKKLRVESLCDRACLPCLHKIKQAA